MPLDTPSKTRCEEIDNRYTPHVLVTAANRRVCRLCGQGQPGPARRFATWMMLPRRVAIIAYVSATFFHVLASNSNHAADVDCS
jgi:hypothetical protein